MTLDTHDEPLDRRVRRTRAAIVAAFNRLILERGYASLTPGDVAAAAEVGRSTFYEHFRSIDDVLARALEALLAPLARSCFEDQPREDARRTVEHIWQNRRLAQILFAGEARRVVLRSFAAHFEAALKRLPRPKRQPPMLKTDLIALHLAASQLALIEGWISGRYGHSAEEIAAALQASGHASALALVGA